MIIIINIVNELSIVIMDILHLLEYYQFYFGLINKFGNL